MSLTVLYEDNHIIAVVKPAGILVQADETGDGTLTDEVKFYLKQKYNKLGNVWLGVVHRLDRPVSGIVVFGKTSKGAARLSEQIRNHTFKKTYQALVWGVPKKTSATLVHWLKKDERTNKVAVFDHEVDGGLRAELDYSVTEKRGDKSLLTINLKTGRPHQIRAQLAHVGCPIVGDIKYGAPEALFDRSLALCAVAVEFKLATSDEIKKIVIDIPNTWNNK
jgi:23S rRNA pseudouridine1911/1915/1917 synthase